MTSKAPAAKRTQSTPSVPVAKPPCDIHSSAVIADKAQITGTHLVKVEENAILHPYAKIRSDHGKVAIGKNSIIYETAVVGKAEASEQDVIIGEGVTIETGAIVQAKSVGDGSVIEIHATVGAGAVLGRYCKVAPMEKVEAEEVLEDFTVVYGDGLRRVDRTLKEHAEIREAREVERTRVIELTKKLIPNAAAKWMT